MTNRFVRTHPIISPEDFRKETSPDQSLEQPKISRIQIPDKMEFLFMPSRYKVAYGGRGGIKSWSFARALLIKGARSCIRVLCAREFQNSIKESVHRLLQDQVELMGLSDYYPSSLILSTEIHSVTGTEFVFAGIRNNVTKIKSMEGIDICWIEEAEKVSENSWSVLIPTIRKSGSELWVSFNPHEERDPTYKKFITNREAVLKEFPGSVIIETSWRDNPWLPKELEAEKDYLARVDKDAYDHVWGGQVQKRSSSQVMRGKCFLEAFVPRPDECSCGHSLTDHLNGPCASLTPALCGCRKFISSWNGPYYGADWGFAADPAVLVKKWIRENVLYIEEEFWGIGVELDDLSKKFDAVSGAREHAVRADNARPETISYLQRHGYPRLTAASKWPGSVEDGISFLRSFEKIVIHPRCVHMDEESRTYKHKVDQLTGDILPDIIDKNNHCWDAVRYGLEPLISARSAPGLFFAGPSLAPKAQERKAEKEVSCALACRDHAIKGGRDRDVAMNRWLRGD